MASFSQQSPQQLKTSFIETLTDEQMKVELATIKRAICRQPRLVCTKAEQDNCQYMNNMNNSRSKMPTNLIERITTKETMYKQVSHSEA